MPFCLPESRLNVRQVTFACLNVDLVETRVDAYCLNVVRTLPISLDGRMKILSNCVGASIPKSCPFDEAEAERVVGQGKSAVEDGKHVGVMQTGVKLIEGARNDGNVQVIPGENLIGRINEGVPSLVVFLVCQVILYFLEVNGRNPSISIDDGEKHVISIDSQWLEKNLLKMLGAPRNVSRLSLLLKLPEMMLRVAHQSKLAPVHLNELLRFQLRVFFMGLHCQKDHNPCLGPGMAGQLIKRLRQQFDILSITGDDESVKYIVLQLILHIHFLLEIYGPIDERVRLEEGDDGNEEHDCGFEAEISKRHDADLLILHLYEGGSNKHECPVEDVDEGNDQLVFEVVLEVVDVHAQDQVDIQQLNKNIRIIFRLNGQINIFQGETNDCFIVCEQGRGKSCRCRVVGTVACSFRIWIIAKYRWELSYRVETIQQLQFLQGFRCKFGRMAPYMHLRTLTLASLQTTIFFECHPQNIDNVIFCISQ